MRFALLVLCFATSPAWAAAGDYSGSYDLSCTGLHLQIDTNVTYNDVLGGVAYPDAWTLDLPCAVSPRALQGWARGVAQDCRATGVPWPVCRDFAINLFQVVRPYADTAAHVAPESVDVSVNTWSSPLAFMGVYDTSYMLHYAYAPDLLGYGSLQSAPADEGYVWLPQLGLEGAVNGNAVCVGAAGGLFEGHIDPLAFGFVGHYGVGAGLACAAATTDTAQLWTASIGVSADVSLTGAPTP